MLKKCVIVWCHIYGISHNTNEMQVPQVNTFSISLKLFHFI